MPLLKTKHVTSIAVLQKRINTLIIVHNCIINIHNCTLITTRLCVQINSFEICYKLDLDFYVKKI